jgi:hypothetical protein
MKALLTFFALALCFSLAAQNLQLTASSSTAYGDVYESELIIGVGVKNVSSTEQLVRVTRQLISNPQNFENYFCWNACFDPSVSISGNKLIQPGYTSNDFTAHLKPQGSVGTASFRYVFFINGQNDSIPFQATFSVTPVSVEKIDLNSNFLSDFFPNPANEKVSFNYNVLGGNSKIVIYNAIGSRVYESVLNPLEKTQSIDTEKFQSGIYFASLEVNGKLTNTKRLIIKR